MRKILLATAATALLGWAASASAAPIDTLSYNVIVNGTSYGTSSSTTGTLTGTVTGGGFTVIILSNGYPVLNEPDFSNTSYSISDHTGTGTVEVEITQTGLTSPAEEVADTYTTNSTTGANFTSDTITNYYDNTDTPYGTGSTLGSASFSGLSSFSSNDMTYLASTGTFSETTIYMMTFGPNPTGGTVSASSQIAAAATPEPNSLVLLGTGLIGAAGMLFMRRRQAADLL